MKNQIYTAYGLKEYNTFFEDHLIEPHPFSNVIEEMFIRGENRRTKYHRYHD